MKHTGKRLLSALLILIMVLTMIPASVLAADPELTLRVPEIGAVAGSTVKVQLALENNPGLAAMKVKVSFGDMLTLTNVEFNDAMGGQYQMPQTMNSPVSLTWYNGVANFTDETAIFATLTFDVSADAYVGEVAEITVSHNSGDIYNILENDIPLTVIDGYVAILDCVPGDINGDGLTNLKDQSRLFQYLADWDVVVNEPALDTNGDGKVNMKDQTRLFQYLADWDVPLYPIVNKPCEHERTYVEQQESTCTEDGVQAHWYCAECDKCFVSETGNNTMENTVIPATGHTEESYSASGCTDGIRCKICGEIIVEAAPIEGNVYTVTYDPDYNDPYLSRQNIVIEEQYLSYIEGVGLSDLPRPEVAGYEFKGWYDPLNPDVLVTSIGADETGNKTLYPRWEKTTYYVYFDSPGVPVEKKTYTVDVGVPLDKPEEQLGLLFIGWSDDNGELFTAIRPGMTGNRTLHANWTSLRNMTTSEPVANEPLKIIEDAKNGQYLFIYKAGQIENVPLNVLDNIGYKPSLNETYTVSTSYSVGTDMSKTIAEMVSNTTTKSSAITLSEDWNTIISAENETEETKAKTKEYVDSYGVTQGGKYYVSNSQGGASAVTKGTSGSNSVSAKVATEHSAGVEGSYDTQTETSASCKLSAENKLETEAGVSLPIDIIEVSAGMKNTTTVGAEVESSRKDAAQSHFGYYEDTYVGTENNYASSYSYDTSISKSTNWNSEQGYESSHQTTQESSVKEAVEDVIRTNSKNGVEKALGGSNEETTTVGYESSTDEEYTTTLRYYNETTTTEEKTSVYQYDAPGYYRLVTAGIIEVYAIVGYDVANEAFFVNMYSVLTDTVQPYMDYSPNDGNYNNCQNGAIVFDVPHYVNDYVQARVGKSQGLTMNGETVDEYWGEDTTVIVPAWYSKNNGDGSYTAIPVKAINEKAFAGNTTIETVILPEDLAEIPAGAFAGCTSLKTVIAPGVTKIGAGAFAGCENLGAFNVDAMVTELGEGAFGPFEDEDGNVYEGVESLTVTAADAQIAMAALASGAKDISLYLGSMRNALDNQVLEVPEGTQSVAIYGERKTTVNNTTLVSHAQKTVLNGITFNTDGAVVLTLHSDEIELAEVNVNTNAIAMISHAADAQIDLLGISTMMTTGTIAVLSKNVAFSYVDRTITSALNITGDMYYCDTFTKESDSLVTVTGETRAITEDEFEDYMNLHTLTFDPNGGEVDVTTKTVYFGRTYGELPTPTRDYYTFDGWYTEAYGGTKVTSSDVYEAVIDTVLYAHWTQNGISDWVLASDAPADAEIADEKWTYDLTTNITSSNRSEDGYTLYDTTWVWSDYGSWSSWSKTAATASDSRQVETKTVTDRAAYTNYKYSVWRTSDGYGYGTKNYYTGDKHGSCTEYDEINITYQLPVHDSSLGTYGPYNSSMFSHSYDSYWFYDGSNNVAAVTHKEYRYRDREQVYTYYHTKTEAQESSTEVVASDTISNVQAWVRYREK